MKKITLIIPLCISLIVFWSCSHKYNYSKYYSYMANRYVKVYESTIEPQFILNFIILHQNSNEQDSCGVYELNAGPGGGWNDYWRMEYKEQHIDITSSQYLHIFEFQNYRHNISKRFRYLFRYHGLPLLNQKRRIDRRHRLLRFLQIKERRVCIWQEGIYLW